MARQRHGTGSPKGGNGIVATKPSSLAKTSKTTLPNGLRLRPHNDCYILSGSIDPNSVADCLKSVFLWHNETLNIWTHALGACTMVWLLMQTFMDVHRMTIYPDDQGKMADQEEIIRLYLPLILYSVGNISVMLVSSSAHIFHQLSRRASDIGFTMDYVAIGLYSTTGAVASFYYSRPLGEEPFAVLFSSPTRFILFATICHLCAFFIISIMRQKRSLVPQGIRKFILVLAYVVSATLNSLPFLLRSFFCQSLEACKDVNVSFWPHWQHGALHIAAGFVTATQFPEKLAPGRFDYIGNSHQLMHIAIWSGMWFEWKALDLDLRYRQDELVAAHVLPDMCLVAAAPCLYLLTALPFSAWLLWEKTTKSAQWSRCVLTGPLCTRQNEHQDKFRCYRRFQDQGRSSDNFKNLVPDFRSCLMIDLGRETDGNNEICLSIRFALCIIKAPWLARIEHCPGTVVTLSFLFNWSNRLYYEWFRPSTCTACWLFSIHFHSIHWSHGFW